MFIKFWNAILQDVPAELRPVEPDAEEKIALPFLFWVIVLSTVLFTILGFIFQ